jgi:hypothetical protein
MPALRVNRKSSPANWASAFDPKADLLSRVWADIICDHVCTCVAALLASKLRSRRTGRTT